MVTIPKDWHEWFVLIVLINFICGMIGIGSVYKEKPILNSINMKKQLYLSIPCSCIINCTIFLDLLIELVIDSFSFQ